MLALLLVLCSTLSEEISESIGKKSVKLKRETIYGLGFLELFWGFVVMVGLVIFGHHNRFSFDSLPTLIPRIGLEVLVAYTVVESIARVERSTMGFLRLTTIPFLLLVDIVLGYHLTALQITGVLVMFFALVLAFHRNPSGKRGAWIVVLSSLLCVGTVSLYKYDITHYNSVAVEQSIVMGIILVLFYFKARRPGRSPFRMLIQPITGTQAIASGLSSILASFSMLFAPASVVIALKRTFALLWAVLFGRAYFREHSVKRKLVSFGITAVGIVLLVSPYWPHWHWV
jgi:hypothetical protein